MLNVIEINEMRVKQQKLLKEKNTAHQSFHEAHTRIMEDLDEQERIAHDELVKRIRKHFKGVNVTITVSQTQLKVTAGTQFIFEYLYNDWSFEQISKKIADKITLEYNEVYGYPKKKSYISSITTHHADALEYSRLLNFPRYNL